MVSSFVIKVQHSGTLRRFNASIKKNGQLNLDMVALKTKILGLFDFPADADLKLTYVDEDGDVVTLVDDDDLSDVTWQSLAFLRINVLLNNGRRARSNGGTTLMKPSNSADTSQMGSSSLTKVQSSQGGSAAIERKLASEVPTINNDQLKGILTMALIGFLLLFLFLLSCAYGPSILTMSPIIILIVLIIVDFTWCDSFNAVDH